MPEEEGEECKSDGQTDSTQSRHWLTNDLIAGLLNLSLVMFVGLSVLGYGVTPPDLIMKVYVASVLLANLWAFGAQAAKRLSDMIGG